jgi:hypothetical protein
VNDRIFCFLHRRPAFRTLRMNSAPRTRKTVRTEVCECQPPINRLQPVTEHRTIGLLEDVARHLHDEVLPDTKDVPVECGVVTEGDMHKAIPDTEMSPNCAMKQP